MLIGFLHREYEGGYAISQERYARGLDSLQHGCGNGYAPNVFPDYYAQLKGYVLSACKHCV